MVADGVARQLMLMTRRTVFDYGNISSCQRERQRCENAFDYPLCPPYSTFFLRGASIHHIARRRDLLKPDVVDNESLNDPALMNTSRGGAELHALPGLLVRYFGEASFD